MTELALPAGSLETALVAFNNGADAVYFGLKEFSARKGAVNFSLEDLSKIRRYSLENKKKIYITINTLLNDSEIDRIIPILDEVAFYGNDGIIVQDLGLAYIIRKYYPSLPLHASTQLAIHTPEGVKALEDLGFERVVLSRELTLKEIEKIRKDCPQIQLKVFIHGALCYGFSGLCSASYIKCERSANRGECAQICRSWFKTEQNKKGYPFSMEDLFIREEVKILRDMKIDSLKIEGRLKSPEYVAATARYYRRLLDDKEVNESDIDYVKTTFLRKSGDGYLNYSNNRSSLLSGNYPGHMGLDLGRVVKQNKGAFFLETRESVENHDGLQYFIEDSSSLLNPTKFSANIVGKTKTGYIISNESKQSLLNKEIYKISDSTKRIKTYSTNIPLFHKPVDITLILRKDEIEIKALGESFISPIVVLEAKNKSNFLDLLNKTFKESGDSKYTLNNLTFINCSGISFPFVQPSILKSIRRSFYAILDEKKLISPDIEKREKIDSFNLPQRDLLKNDFIFKSEIITINENKYLSFPPITFDEEKAWNEILKEAEGQKNLFVGLNNISQIRFAKKHPEFTYFVDVFLYLSNRYAFSLLKDEIPSLNSGYIWFERKDEPTGWEIEPTSTRTYTPPLFISRSCYRNDYLGLECNKCKRSEDFFIEQNGDKYIVKIRKCLTIVERLSSK